MSVDIGDGTPRPRKRKYSRKRSYLTISNWQYTWNLYSQFFFYNGNRARVFVCVCLMDLHIRLAFKYYYNLCTKLTRNIHCHFIN